MPIMSGLAGTEAGRPVASHQSAVGQWAIRNAWGLILTGSLAFWLTIAAFLVWR